MSILLAKEYDDDLSSLTSHHQREYYYCPKNLVISRRTIDRGRGSKTIARVSRTRWWTKVTRELFLPVGYPSSVRIGYIEYQAYDSLQGLCSYLRGVVTTAAVLRAAGVGDVNADAAGAAMQWALRDGLGMIGGLLFSYSASHRFDSHSKEYRLFADIANNVGLTIDMLAPHVPRSMLLWTSGLATLCRVACGMAAGATKGAITRHFALRNNASDLDAKEGTQETLVSLLGMVFGVLLAKALRTLENTRMEHAVVDDGGDANSNDNNGGGSVDIALWATWLAFAFLTILHMWANHRGVSSLRLRSLNRERARIALNCVSNACASAIMQESKLDKVLPSIRKANVLSPDDVQESLLSYVLDIVGFSSRDNGKTNMLLGVSISETLQGKSVSQALCLLSGQEDNKKKKKNVDRENDEGYVITVQQRRRKGWFTICVTLRRGATETHELKSFLHAMVISRCLYLMETVKSEKGWEDGGMIESRTRECVNTVFDEGVLSPDLLWRHGWDSGILLGYGRSRATWESHTNVEKEE